MRLNHEWTQIDTNEIPPQVDSKTGSPNGGRKMEPKTELRLTLVRSYLVTLAGFLRGNSTHLFGVTRFGAPGVYVRAGSSHHNEVVWPQPPRTESGQAIPPIGASSSCLPKSPSPFLL